jgi:hypothetical protein
VTAKKLGVPLAECRTCAEPIRFVRLDTGKAMPVNPLPDPRGNVTASVIMGRLAGFVISEEHQPRPGAMRFVPHFATCEERKKKAKADGPSPAEEPLW